MVVLSVWRHVYRRFPLRYDPLYWGAVFPLGMYTAATTRLSTALGADYLLVIPRVTIFVALVVWALVFSGMLVHLARALRQLGRPSEAAR